MYRDDDVDSLRALATTLRHDLEAVNARLAAAEKRQRDPDLLAKRSEVDRGNNPHEGKGGVVAIICILMIFVVGVIKALVADSAAR